MKRTGRAQFAFKREADPNRLFNRGGMIALDAPVFDFATGRIWLFSAPSTRGGA